MHSTVALPKTGPCRTSWARRVPGYRPADRVSGSL